MRNLGYISKLKDLLDEIESKELSLEKLNEAKEDIKEQAPVENKKETSNNNVKNNNLKKAYVKPQNKK